MPAGRFSTSPEYAVEDRGFGTPCWVWQRAVNENGYGRMPGNQAAHRVYFERERGPVPDGLEIDHLCRVRACVRPDHMEAVTHAENVRRMYAAGGRPWVPNERQLLIVDLAREGLLAWEIGERVGTTPGAVIRQLLQLRRRGIDLPPIVQGRRAYGPAVA